MTTAAALFSSASCDWWTPSPIIQATIRLLGGIDTDPASNAGAPNIPADTCLTEADDGLSQPWHGRVYLNPPYGRTVGRWTAKAIEEVDAGRAESVIMLVAARTDTDWFQPLIDYPICWVDGRIRFIDGSTGAPLKAGAPFPSALVFLRREYRGDDLRQFADVFGRFGKVTLGAL